MKIYQHPQFSIFFGDKTNAFAKEQFYNLADSRSFLQQPQFEFLKNSDSSNIIFANQVHKTDGLIITSHEQAQAYKPYSAQADFIITNVPGVAIGVATADCLPIIFYDPHNNVIAVAHAGWQGTVGGIAPITVQAMINNFGCEPQDILTFFGPCASVENYEVSADFGQSASLLDTSGCAVHSKWADPSISSDFEQKREIVSRYETQQALNQTITQKNNKYYFNMPLYNQKLLQAVGVTNFNYDFNSCTIAHQNFCSYRREKEKALRQMTIAMLK